MGMPEYLRQAEIEDRASRVRAREHKITLSRDTLDFVVSALQTAAAVSTDHGHDQQAGIYRRIWRELDSLRETQR